MAIGTVILVLLITYPVILERLDRSTTSSTKVSIYLSPLTYLGGMCALLLAGWLRFEQTTLHATLFTIESPTGWNIISFGVEMDALSGLLMSLVLFLGAIVARFSVRYLEDDPRRAAFTRNLSATLCSVLLLLSAQNILLLIFAWTSSSYFLNKLLTFYEDRKAAITGAEQKFWISRFGEGLLIVSSMIYFEIFGSFDFAVINAHGAHPLSSPLRETFFHLGSVLLVVGACIKSAQFPFHFWLPNTLDTPTPVSALMHAGIVNAGGYLLIRLSPTLIGSPFSLALLALIGAVSALYGCLAMMPQAGLKNALAYSTIAQMGFMMLQCGLGAFSLATLHIVGHAIYKAYSFLSSGTAIQKKELFQYHRHETKNKDSFILSATSLFLATALLLPIAWIFGLSLSDKGADLILLLILVLAMSQVIAQSARLTHGLTYSAIIAGTYILLAQGAKWFVGHSISTAPVSVWGAQLAVFAIISVFFLSLYLLQFLQNRVTRNTARDRLYVHMLNGGYIGRL